ncbi:MAG: hypothetical protein JNM34_06785 [Chthonomonadaceae bacterium]|nr:hypothetical protein [Chthonomonadaceae bacterium]
MRLFEACAPDFPVTDPGLATIEDVKLVHGSDYIDTVQRLSQGLSCPEEAVRAAGFLSGDNPAFSGMHDAALAYSGGATQAARDIANGGMLSMTVTGGLHHARQNQASGFCIYNDCAMAVSILRKAFERVLYVDIDLHHGDGVQWIFYEDRSVMTLSIHEDGRFLYPGTGHVSERGAENSSVNIPLLPYTTGDVWLDALREVLKASVDRFRPEAVVLQMGTDAHVLDPLGHLSVSAQEWLEGIVLVKDLGLPLVALGGGGYEQTTVPRMWVAALLTLLGLPVPDTQPDGRAFFDENLPTPRDNNRAQAEDIVRRVLHG